MSKIELKHIDKYYGKNHILKDVNLTIEDGDFMTLLGPSGCGKTTTLRVVSGLEKPQNGTILMNGKEIVNAAEAHFAPRASASSTWFSSPTLCGRNDMTVRENIAFGLNLQKLPKDEVNRRIEDALARMQIGQYVDRYPSELSGGQQQRVAIARAIASEPHLLLMDEPLSNLDAKLRVDMRSELKRLHIETGTTMIYVTHDQVEALTMSTKIAIFKEGVIVQVDHPLELYNNPVNLYVADFIGNPSINFADGKAEVGFGRHDHYQPARQDGIPEEGPHRHAAEGKELRRSPRHPSRAALHQHHPSVSLRTSRRTSTPPCRQAPRPLVTVKVGGVSSSSRLSASRTTIRTRSFICPST